LLDYPSLSDKMRYVIICRALLGFQTYNDVYRLVELDWSVIKFKLNRQKRYFFGNTNECLVSVCVRACVCSMFAGYRNVRWTQNTIFVGYMCITGLTVNTYRIMTAYKHPRRIIGGFIYSWGWSVLMKYL